MPDRSRKEKVGDLNALAASIAAHATGEQVDETENLLAKAQAEGKNPAAVLLGRQGGLKGGKARAKKLTAKRRREIAKKAAQARWKDR